MLTNLASSGSESFASLDSGPFSAVQPALVRSSHWQSHRDLRHGEQPQAYARALDIDVDCLVEVSPEVAVSRQALAWEGVIAEMVETRDFDRSEFSYCGTNHLLVVCERGTRRVGETSVASLPRSNLRDLAGKISFVPAGREFRHSQEPRTPTRFVF